MLRVRDRKTSEIWWLEPIKCDKGLAFSRKTNPDDKYGVEIHFSTIKDFQMQYADYEEMSSIEKSFIKAIKYFYGLENDCLITKNGNYLIILGKENNAQVVFNDCEQTRAIWTGEHYQSLKQGELYQIKELMENEDD